MIKSIEEYTAYLFDCCFADESFDSEEHEDHLKVSWELFDNYDWNDIYLAWMRYLYTKCAETETVINFANLFVYYGAAERLMADPIEFVSYLYYRVDVHKYWDKAGDLFDTIAINVFSRCGLINLMEDPYYSPLEDERIIDGIRRWKNKSTQ